MQINVLPPSRTGVMTMARFPEITQEARNWVQNQIAEGARYLTDAGLTFYNNAVETWKSVADGSLEHMARSMLRSVGSFLHPNAIIPIYSIEDLQTAKPVMQRFIMAHPELRDIYHRQLCDGYSDSYVDDEPGLIGHDHREYRQVMDGMVVETIDENGESKYTVNFYSPDLQEGERQLTVDEQFDILTCWDTVDISILRKRDCTDIFNSDLGI